MSRFRARNALRTLSEAAQITGLSRRTLKRLLDDKRIPYETANVPGSTRPWRRIRDSVLDSLMVKHNTST
jgi:excisionase family DNA binding protein